MPDKNKETFKQSYQRLIQTHEPATNAKLIELAVNLPRNAVVVDCGAHVGDTGLQLAKKLKSRGRSDVRIVEIDPDKGKCEFIRSQAKEEGVAGMVEVINCGLWNKNSFGKVKKVGNSTGEWQVLDVPKRQSEFRLRTLDSLVNRLDLLHLDVEGSEPKALEGMKKLVEKNKPDIIIEMVHSGKDIKPILSRYGYSPVGERMNLDLLYRHKSKIGEKQEATGAFPRKVWAYQNSANKPQEKQEGASKGALTGPQEVEEYTQWFGLAGLVTALLALPFVYRLRRIRPLVVVSVATLALFAIGQIVKGKQSWVKIFIDATVFLLALAQLFTTARLTLTRRALAESP